MSNERLEGEMTKEDYVDTELDQSDLTELNGGLARKTDYRTATTTRSLPPVDEPRGSSICVRI